MPAAAQSFDLVVIAEPRLRYADGRCLAALLATAAAHGYRTGLLPVLGALPSPGPPVHPQVAAVLASGDVALLDGDRPHDAGLALVYDLLSVRQPVERPWAVRPERLLLRIDQPWRALDGTPLLSLPQALKHAAGFCNVQPELACADPLLQERLCQEGFAGAVLWPSNQQLGRSRGGWPSRARWPSCWRRRGGVAGGRRPWRTRHPGRGCGPVGSTRRKLAAPTGRAGRPRGLSRQPRDLPAHGRPALAACASERARGGAGDRHADAGGTGAGAPARTRCGLCRGGGCAGRNGVDDAGPALDLADGSQGAARDAHEARRHSSARLKEQLGPPRPHPPRLTLRRELRTRRRALFLSPNGIGMGHLTRLLAVARRLGPELEPVFLSMSQAVGVVEGMGYRRRVLSLSPAFGRDRRRLERSTAGPARRGDRVLRRTLRRARRQRPLPGPGRMRGRPPEPQLRLDPPRPVAGGCGEGGPRAGPAFRPRDRARRARSRAGPRTHRRPCRGRAAHRPRRLP